MLANTRWSDQWPKEQRLLAFASRSQQRAAHVTDSGTAGTVRHPANIPHASHVPAPLEN